MFKYKTEAELSAMTAEQRDIYSEQKRDHEANLRKAEFVAMFKAFFGLSKNEDGTENKEEVTLDQIKAKMVSSGISKAEFDEVKELVNQWKEQNGLNSEKNTPIAVLSAEIKANKESLKAVIKNNGKEVTLKANTVRASIATNPHYLVLDGIGQLQRIARSLYNRFRKIPVSRGNHNGTIAYVDWDEATTIKAAAMVAEGQPFPESTAKFKGYTLPLRKIGDTLPVSEEFFEDEEMAAAELDLFLSTNVDNVVDDEIVNGDNTGEHLKGLIASVPAYTPVASGIVDANVYDLIVKMKSAITSVGGAKYMPNFVTMNEDTLNLLVLKKDANHNYQFPPQHPIYNMIVVDNHVPDDTMIVGDDRFARIYEMAGVTVSRGVVNAQFTEDLVTIKARKRLAFLIRTVDQTGFRKVTDIAAALATLEAIPE
jgi:HK97 family phage major capsid protein